MPELDADELAAWRGMLRIHHRVRQALGAELMRRHGLSTADYDALVTMAGRPGSEIRMAELAEEILQPRSSVTRIVGSLQERGLVERGAVAGDGRGITARLTAAGVQRFRAAHRTHVQGVRDRFLGHLTGEQQRLLAQAWAAIDPAVLD